VCVRERVCVCVCCAILDAEVLESMAVTNEHFRTSLGTVRVYPCVYVGERERARVCERE